MKGVPFWRLPVYKTLLTSLSGLNHHHVTKQTFVQPGLLALPRGVGIISPCQFGWGGVLLKNEKLFPVSDQEEEHFERNS